MKNSLKTARAKYYTKLFNSEEYRQKCELLIYENGYDIHNLKKKGLLWNHYNSYWLSFRGIRRQSSPTNLHPRIKQIMKEKLFLTETENRCSHEITPRRIGKAPTIHENCPLEFK